MRVESMEIPDVKRVMLDVFADARGVFAETYHREKFAELGIHDGFVQDAHSRSTRPGTVRGLHFQRYPRAQAKLVQVTRGRVFDVAVDLRPSSETFGRHVSLTLEEGDGTVVYIPRGFAHGFCTLDPDTEVVYKMSDHHSPEHYAGVRWDDPALGIDWPVDPQDAILSANDQAHPGLAELDHTGLIDPTAPRPEEAPS